MRNLILLLAAASSAFAQLDSNVLTITASRQLNVQPDQVSLSMYVTTDANQTLDNVLSALQGTKITAADLSSVNTAAGSELQWLFTPTVSFSDLNKVLAALGALQANGPITVNYFYLNATASQQAVASQPCPYPALINDAQTQAQKLAAAAGVTVGPIVSLAQGGAPGVVPVAAARLGDFSSFLLGNPLPVAIYDPLTALAFATSGSSSACTLTVQFKLGQ